MKKVALTLVFAAVKRKMLSVKAFKLIGFFVEIVKREFLVCVGNVYRKKL